MVMSACVSSDGCVVMGACECGNDVFSLSHI